MSINIDVISDCPVSIGQFFLFGDLYHFPCESAADTPENEGTKCVFAVKVLQV